MEEYLSIPTKQLAHLTRHCLHKTTSSRLIEHVKRSYSDSEHAAMIVQQITNLDEKRRVEFSNEMEQLSVRRVTLAHSLTHTLSHIEKKAQVFLIKPVYATPRGPRSHALITPIARALPLIHNRPTAVSRPRSTVTHSDRSTPHPNMRLVSGLLQSRQSQRGEQGIASEHTVWNFSSISMIKISVAGYYTVSLDHNLQKIVVALFSASPAFSAYNKELGRRQGNYVMSK